MLKRGILNAQLRGLLARTGHRDRIAITDAGYNIPLGVEVVDLAFLPNLPNILDVLDGVLEEFSVEKFLLAEEIHHYAPHLLDSYCARLPANAEIEFVPHSVFDTEFPALKGVVRTGQYGLHAPNIIIQAGCTYD